MEDQNLSDLTKNLETLALQENPLKDLCSDLQKTLFYLKNPKIPKRFPKLIQSKLESLSINRIINPQETEIRSFIKTFTSIITLPLQLGIPEFRDFFNEIFPEGMKISEVSAKFESKGPKNKSFTSSLLSEVIYMKILQVFDRNVEDSRLMDFLLDIYARFDLGNPSFLLSFTENKLSAEFSSDSQETKTEKLIFSIFSSCENFEFFWRANYNLSPVLEHIRDFELDDVSLKVQLDNQGENQKTWEISQLGIMNEASRKDKITTIGSCEEADICIPGVVPLAAAVFIYEDFIIKECSNSPLKFVIESCVFVPIYYSNQFEFNGEVLLKIEEDIMFYNLDGKEFNKRLDFSKKIAEYEIPGTDIKFFILVYEQTLGFCFRDENIRVLAYYSNFFVPANNLAYLETHCKLFPDGFKKVIFNNPQKVNFENYDFRSVNIQIGNNLLEFRKDY